MRSELEQRLFTDFPHMFRTRLDPYYPLSSWGVECDDEWFELIYELTRQIHDYIQDKPELRDLQVNQIKEKFGTLRYYVRPRDEYIGELIDRAREASARLQENASPCAGDQGDDSQDCAG